MKHRSFGELIVFALQQIVVMFPATVLVALITGFHVSTTIFASGLATLVFILVTGRKIPLYYGSSFSYIAAIASIMGAEAFAGLSLNERISIAQFGIVMSGFVSIAAGMIIKRSGKGSHRPGTASYSHRQYCDYHRLVPGSHCYE